MQASRKEVESHSSALTNIRLNETFKLVSAAELSATGVFKPTVQDAIGYHSVLLTLFMETASIIKTDDKNYEKIEKLVKDGEQMISDLKRGKGDKQYHVEDSIQNSKKLRFLIQAGLQNLNYFFRMGKHDPKGISQSLELFEGTRKKNVPDNK